MADKTKFKNNEAFQKLCRAAVLANEGQIEKENGTWQGEGDAVDIALLLMAQNTGVDVKETRDDFKEKNRIPYESEQKYAAGFHERGGKTYIFAKGAAKTLLEMCPDADQDEIKKQEKDLSRQQYRVLGFVSGKAERNGPYDESDLTNLRFLGLAGMRDPLRGEAGDSIKQCKSAGIKVVMITGDQPDTAHAIATELSLSEDKDDVVTGQDLKKAAKESEKALDDLTSKTKIYARIEPRQKLDILESLQRGGDFVAMTGDGVNDAPALKHAHVGVAMGKSGTDVARESADIILTDDNFASIVAGVQEGRCAYNNIRKIIYFLMSTALAEVLLYLAAVISSMPVPFLATQLLWINFVTSIIQDVAHAFDKPEGDELEYPPRKPDEPIFDRLMIVRVLVTAIAMTLIGFAEFTWMQGQDYAIEDIRNFLVLQFVLFENVIALNSRSEHLSFFGQGLMKNPFLIYGTIAAQLLHIGAMYTPGLSDVLHIHPVSLLEWIILGGCALVVMMVIEIEKTVRRRYFASRKGT